MKLFSAGGLRVRATGGTDRDGGGTGPAVLLCHGFGAGGDDLVGLARVLDVGAGTRWFFPEAPHPVDGGGDGRAWWPIDMVAMQLAIARGDARNLTGETPDGLEPAVRALTACIDELVASHGVVRSALVIGGFSQGAMLTTEIALHAPPKTYAGLAVLSGTLLSRDRWVEAAATGAVGLHVLESHGRRDPILPFGGAEALAAMLRDAGAEVTFVPFAGQHEIPGVVMDALGSFCRARLA